MSDHKNKISRIKIKPNENITIYIIFIINLISDISNKLYIYIDDRTYDTKTVQKTIDNILNILRNFNIRLPDKIIRYSDYYETTRIYLHQLIRLKKTLINYNSNPQPDDLFMFISNIEKIKIFLNQDDTSDNLIYKSKYDNLLYDNGWYRDILIETIIDHSENIDYIIDSRLTNTINIGSNSENLFEINKNIITKICNILNFSQPDIVFTNITDNLDNFGKYKLSNSDNLFPTLNNLTLDQILIMKLEMKDIRHMIENNDISLKKYILYCDEYENNIFDPSVKDICQICCLFDPINIRIDDYRQIDINSTPFKINTFFIDKSEFQLIENKFLQKKNINKDTSDDQYFKIRYVGSVSMNKDKDGYVYKWTNNNKKKKDIQIKKWIPGGSEIILPKIQANINKEELSGCIIDNIHNFYYNDTGLHQIVIYYQQLKLFTTYLLFKIKSHYYIRHPINKNSLMCLF